MLGSFDAPSAGSGYEGKCYTRLTLVKRTNSVDSSGVSKFGFRGSSTSQRDDISGSWSPLASGHA